MSPTLLSPFLSLIVARSCRRDPFSSFIGTKQATLKPCTAASSKDSKAKTGNNLLSHPLLAELRTGDSLDVVLTAPSSQEEVPDQYLGRDDGLLRSRNPALNVFRSSFVSNDISAGWVSLESVKHSGFDHWFYFSDFLAHRGSHWNCSPTPCR